MIIKNLYESNCSGMDSFKRSCKIIKYNLCESVTEEDGIGYGIQVITYFEDFYEGKIIKAISKDINLVKKLIKFLYENCVDVVHFEDIVQDYILNNE